LEFGSGLVLARLPNGRDWSPPCAIGTAGISWGALVGAQISDHVFLLMTDEAVDILTSNDGSVQLGADIGVAIGPLGRSVEADLAASGTDDPRNIRKNKISIAPIYTYSLSKGLYAGISLDGKIIVTRHRVNEKFYGMQVDTKALFSGEIPTPPAAQPLYDALKRCHIYANSSMIPTRGAVGMLRSVTSPMHSNPVNDHFSNNFFPPSMDEEQYNIMGRNHYST